MTTHVALLRGVNVSGANRLPMAEFRELLGGLGLTRVQTYIASGNAVFDSDMGATLLGPMIRDATCARFGFAPDVFMLTPDDLRLALTENPFAAADPARVHVYFLTRPAMPDNAALQVLAAAGDAWLAAGTRFTLSTPAGVGTSKLAEKLPRFLPAPMTARNMRTLAALVAMTELRFPS